MQILKFLFRFRKDNFLKEVHIPFLIATTVALAGTVVSGMLQWKNQGDSYNEISIRLADDRKNEVNQVVRVIEYKFNKLVKILNIENKSINEIFTNAEKYKNLLIHSMGMIPGVSSIFMADVKGYVFDVPDRVSETELNITSRPWFISPTDDHNKIKFSYGYKDAYTGNNVFSISKSITSEKGNYLVMGMDIDLQSLGILYEKMKYTMPADMYIIDKQGKVVLGDYLKWDDLQLSNNEIPSQHNGFWIKEEIQKRIYFSKMYNPEWTILLVVDSKTWKKFLIRESIISLATIMTMFIVLFVCWWRSNDALKLFYANLINRLKGVDSSSMDNAIDQAINSNKNELEDIEKSAKTDGLTGLLNRRAFDEDLLNALSAPEPVVCLAIIDIDDFKSINDRYGHQTGDDVLKALSSMAMRLISSASLRIYRYGGEEFAIIFKGIELPHAKNIIEELRVSFFTREWRENIEAISFSAGLKSWDGESPNKFLSATDLLLYNAKKSGKNNINGELISKELNQ